VWFDNFRILSTGSLQVQETHGACPDERSDIGKPWGLELTGLGYQYGGVKVNKYLYQGKELIDDNNLNLYDFRARGYDPVIGRTLQIDPGSESYYPMSPYSWVMNNPLKFIDPTGMFTELFNEQGKKIGVDGNIAIVTNNKEAKRVNENTKNGTHTESGTLNSTVNLPSAMIREAMGISVSNSLAPNALVGDTQGGFHEEGGMFGTDANGKERVVHAQSGQVAIPGQDAVATVDVFSGETATNSLSRIEGTFHTHPSGSNAAGGFDQSPSDFVDKTTGQRMGDIPSAQSQANPGSVYHVNGNHYVLGTGNNRVTIYNGGNPRVAIFPLNKFTTIGIKK
jgi:RHS repeat-associated protein